MKLTFSCLLSPRNDVVLCWVTGLSSDLEKRSLVVVCASLSTALFIVSFFGIPSSFFSEACTSCPATNKIVTIHFYCVHVIDAGPNSPTCSSSLLTWSCTSFFTSLLLASFVMLLDSVMLLISSGTCLSCRSRGWLSTPSAVSNFSIFSTISALAYSKA